MKTLYVKDMSCMHCEKRILEALQGAGIEGKVELTKKFVYITQDEDLEKAIIVLDDIGYPAEIV